MRIRVILKKFAFNFLKKQITWEKFIAKAYNKSIEKLNDKLHPLIRELLLSELPSDLTEKGFLLDAGCGPGHTLTRFAKDFHNFTPIGLDFSSAMLSQAKDISSKHGIRHSYFCQGDVHSLPFKDSGFNIIFSMGCLKFMKDPVTCINEIYRVGKPNVVVLFIELNRGATEKEMALFQKRFAIRKWFFRYINIPNSYNLKEVENIIRKTKFTHFNVKPIAGFPLMQVIMKKGYVN